MKKIYYLFAFIGLAAASCNPLDKTYKELGPVPHPVVAAQNLTITLAPADYGLLPGSNYAKTTFSFKTKDDAALSIPTILASKYNGYPDKSTAIVTYALSPAAIAVPDTLYAHVAYTLIPADYLPHSDFSASQVLGWLNTKYPAAAANQLALLTFNYYENGVTSVVTQSFLFLNGAWTKIYTISPAQYNSIGKGGIYNDFTASDIPNLPGYFNAFLKADPAVAGTAKFGNIQYVSYKIYEGANYQSVLPLTFDGVNWITTPTPQTLSFAKVSGTWIADNTVYYSLVSADYTYIGTQTTAGTPDGRANVAQYGDFNVLPGTPTSWADADLKAAFAALLKHLYPGAAISQKFVVTYKVYNGATVSVVKTFQYDGTNFVQL